MTVVSDTSPVSYLVHTQAEEVLPALYGQVLIPDAVRRELGHPEGPEAVRSWIETFPSWLSARSIEARSRELGSGHREKRLQSLDPGEREAILLAEALMDEERGTSLLLIDQQAGRELARARGLEVTGTIGVLGAAAQKGHVDAARAAAALKDTTFRASRPLPLAAPTKAGLMRILDEG